MSATSPSEPRAAVPADTAPVLVQPAPAWPPSIQRVYAALNQPTMDVDEVVQRASVDARLVMRVFALANSPFFDNSGRTVSELRGAVRRLGLSGMRCAVLASALSQWRNAPRLFQLRPEMAPLRVGACNVAALAWRIARQSGGCGEADALLAGLLHNVGKLALVTELGSPKYANVDRREKLLRIARWHARIGAQLAGKWLLPPAIVSAVGAQERLALPSTDEACAPESVALMSVLAAAVEAARTASAAEATAQHLARNSELLLSEAQWRTLLAELPALQGAAQTALGD
jgi:HD-like signal output (HDOD) protein